MGFIVRDGQIIHRAPAAAEEATPAWPAAGAPLGPLYVEVDADAPPDARWHPRFVPPDADPGVDDGAND